MIETTSRSTRAPAGRGLLACMAFVATAAACAETSPWSAYLGVGHVQFDASAQVSANGQVVPGADARATGSTGTAFGVIYAFDPDWSAELALGLPLKSKLEGAGTLSTAGQLGSVTYGPGVFSVRRALAKLGPIEPYFGAGVNYTIVFASKDGFVQNLDARSAWGAVAQAGLGFPLVGPWRLGLDFKKVWIRTTATGDLPALGGAAARASVRLDPLVTVLAVHRTF